MLIIVFVLGIIGLLVSLYAYVTEKKLQTNAQHTPLCDLSQYVSCSRIIKSPYSTLFGISTNRFAIVFYLIIITLAAMESLQLIRYFSFMGLCASVIFAFFMYNYIKAACPLCITLYIINILIFILSHFGGPLYV